MAFHGDWYNVCYKWKILGPINLLRMALQRFKHLCRSRRCHAAFTIMEVLISLTILGIFTLGSTATLNFFETRSARNRNAEAARAIVDDYVNVLLNDNTPAPAATGDGADLDGDGVPDGVPFPGLGLRTLTNGEIPLIVTRNATASGLAAVGSNRGSSVVVDSNLYWRVQPVGTTYGLASATDLLQVNFTLAYVYRGQTYFYKVLTFKAKT